MYDRKNISFYALKNSKFVKIKRDNEECYPICIFRKGFIRNLANIMGLSSNAG